MNVFCKLCYPDPPPDAMTPRRVDGKCEWCAVTLVVDSDGKLFPWRQGEPFPPGANIRQGD